MKETRVLLGYFFGFAGAAAGAFVLAPLAFAYCSTGVVAAGLVVAAVLVARRLLRRQANRVGLLVLVDFHRASLRRR